MLGNMDNITRLAVKKCGGAKELARMLGMSRQAVAKWTVVPPRHVLLVERISGIPRYELRPDLHDRAGPPVRKKAPRFPAPVAA